mmetsp:Transcript_38771/g.76220  ORF Transcript_38771/g.76220 Transcript_38771/m.76220 type:complete len:96 (+) Transcript_38771:569-856(+)
MRREKEFKPHTANRPNAPSSRHLIDLVYMPTRLPAFLLWCSSEHSCRPEMDQARTDKVGLLSQTNDRQASGAGRTTNEMTLAKGQTDGYMHAWVC